MPTPIAPDPADVTIAHLNSVEPGAQAFDYVPDPRPARFIRVIPSGGAGRMARVVHRGLVIVECWGESRTDASALARATDAAMLAMADTGAAYVVNTAATFAFLPDPTSRQARYTATYELFLRAV